ncbi:N-acetylmuramoyl-L-alanine amidase family protein [Clostridium grantii]|uniref:Putative cell wall binding repeat-containing protein n=1 Tax=Clostridium grantii DSM 8605 TaxID=1121316 RepID=A0A1M5RMC3_9CLOT|nr:N-acetylmuramoyl-L-alanine amidase family protein [Clostridium grantii]SHH27043.1 Putative cell wall binding repeat-containing protein [Clostridium grantii DSM 8605]
MKKSNKSLISAVTAFSTVAAMVAPATTAMAAVTGEWSKASGSWMLYNNGQVVKNAWSMDAGKWYYLGADGVMAASKWVKSGSAWYYLGANGAMVEKSWVKHTDGKWYYLGSGGAMVENKWVGNYYLGAGGAMAVDTVTPDGYKVLASGAWDGKDKVTAAIKVESAKAINATQLLVTFNKEVDKTDAETTTNYSVGKYTVATAKLQDDKKSVLITTTAAMSGTSLYIVQPIKSAIDATAKTAIFTNVETYTDTVAPTVLKVEYPTYDTAKVTFSEPMSALGNVTVTQDGSVLNVAPSFTAGTNVATFDLSSVTANKVVSVVIVGARDTGSNLIAQNPTMLSLTKTKSDTTAPTVSSIDVLSDTRVSVTFSEKLKAAPAVTVGEKTVTFTTSEDGMTWVGTFDTITGVQQVKVSEFKDMSSNAGTTVTMLKQVSKDTTKPVLVSSEVKVFNSKSYLVLNFSEEVTADQGIIKGTRVKDYVSNTFTTTTAVTPVAYTKANGADVDNTKAVMLDLSNDTTFPVGAYTVSIPAGFVKDKASTPLVNDAKSVTFTKGTLSVNDTTAPTVNGVPTISADNKTVTVKFSESMDYATALNVANYTVSGQTIFTNAIFSGDNKTVTLTVAPGTITYSGDRLIQVSGTRDLAGNLNTTYSHVVDFNENVAPYVASAKLTAADTISVTFSENVKATTATDFEVYIAGVKVTTGAVTSVSDVATKTATIKLTSPVTDLSKAIQVKLVNTSTVDEKGNAAVTGQLVSVQ